jgi:hypothetical protein
MLEFVLGPRGVDLIVAGAALEAGAILSWRAATGRGPAPLVLLSNFLAGGFLLLALRSALSDQSSPWIAVCLLAALVAHLADLRLRWRGRTQECARAAGAAQGAATSGSNDSQLRNAFSRRQGR